jgi:S-adenosylmethionine:tRNA ribosyltransferase-isomerase
LGNTVNPPENPSADTKGHEGKGVASDGNLHHADGPHAFSLADYDFDLPQELIAAFPSKERGDDLLLILDRQNPALEHKHFSDLSSFLRAGDLLVFNDARVRRARFRVQKLPGGGAAELLLLRARNSDPRESVSQKDGAENSESKLWECLVHTNRKLRPGQVFLLADGSRAEVLRSAAGAAVSVARGAGADVAPPSREDESPSREAEPEGSALIAFEKNITLEFMERYGELPIPPYILGQRARAPSEGFNSSMDNERYQTVYADRASALAAPTAGLHFTNEGLAALREFGVKLAYLTLEVGWGTFAPIHTEDIRAHHMHAEYFELSPQLVQEIECAKKEGRRVVAVGTTVVRALEAAAAQAESLCAEPSAAKSAVQKLLPGRYKTDIFIYPGYQFRVVDALITNFHTPRSSLIALVSAFAGRERILAAYTEAVARRYRFFSYGDAMLIL